MAKKIKEDEQTESVDKADGIAMPTVDSMGSRKAEYDEWIPMSHEEMVTAQENGTLAGYHPKEGLGRVNKEIKKK